MRACMHTHIQTHTHKHTHAQAIFSILLHNCFYILFIFVYLLWNLPSVPDFSSLPLSLSFSAFLFLFPSFLIHDQPYPNILKWTCHHLFAFNFLFPFFPFLYPVYIYFFFFHQICLSFLFSLCLGLYLSASVSVLLWLFPCPSSSLPLFICLSKVQSYARMFTHTKKHTHTHTYTHTITLLNATEKVNNYSYHSCFDLVQEMFP